jgi:hypothetical protein
MKKGGAKMKQLTFNFFKQKTPSVCNENLSPGTAAPKLGFKATQSCKQEEDLFATNEFDEVELVAIKCACGSSWCPTCSKRRWAPNVAEKLKAFDWQRTRQVVLTIDRKLFASGQEAYEHG